MGPPADRGFHRHLGMGFTLTFWLKARHGFLTRLGDGLYDSMMAFPTLGFGSAPDRALGPSCCFAPGPDREDPHAPVSAGACEKDPAGPRTEGQAVGGFLSAPDGNGELLIGNLADILKAMNLDS
jgi:hypothetical protein